MTSDIEELARLFDFPVPSSIVPRYNIAPSQPVGGVRVRADKNGREWTYFSWGLIPFWTKDPRTASRPINARSETVSEKPTFRRAYAHHRCLIPADGYYEWKPEAGGKQPYFFRRRDGKPMALAGLWEIWSGPDGEEVESCAILTTAAGPDTVLIHDRMPVIVEASDFGLWLGEGATENPSELLRPTAGEVLEVYPVSREVNSPQNDGPALILPL